MLLPCYVVISVLSVEVSRSVVLNSEYTCVVVQEFKSIALLDEVSVGTKKQTAEAVWKITQYCLIFCLSGLLLIS